MPYLIVGSEHEDGSAMKGRPLVTRRDWGLAVAMAAVAMMLVLVWSRGIWFFSDAWTLLLYRDVNSIDGLLTPHEGHLVIPPVFFIKGFYRVFGMEYWPWYQLARVLVYGIFAVVLWRVLLHRGATRGLAWTTLAVVLVLAMQAWIMPYTIGNPLIHVVILFVALALNRTEQPALWAGGAVGLALVVGMVTGGLGVALLVAAAVMVAIRRDRGWIVPVAAPFILYVTWYVVYTRGSSSREGLTFQLLRDGPVAAVEIIEHGLTRLITLPADYGPALLLVVAAFILVLGTRRKLDRFDGMMLLVGAMYLGFVILARVSTGLGGISDVRYAYNVVLLLVPVLVPRISLPRAMGTRWSVLAIVVVIVVGGNAVRLHEALGDWSRTLRHSRAVVSSAAALIAAGEPFDPAHPIDGERTARLDAEGVVRLLHDGWNPNLAGDPRMVARARGELRMGFSVREPIRGFRPDDAKELVRVCQRVTPTKPEVVSVGSAGTIVLRRANDVSVELRWTDEFGDGVKRFGLGRGDAFVRLIEPQTQARLEIEVTSGDAATVCNLDTLATSAQP